MSTFMGRSEPRCRTSGLAVQATPRERLGRARRAASSIPRELRGTISRPFLGPRSSRLERLKQLCSFR
eukprot:2829147-Alexandrium_andersonii.AAC.1